jgi:hypothetical protein
MVYENFVICSRPLLDPWGSYISRKLGALDRQKMFGTGTVLPSILSLSTLEL